MDVYPTKLQLHEGVLLDITWSDGQTRQYTVKKLRDACPCATCREKRNQVLDAPPPTAGQGFSLPVLSLQEARPLTIQGMQPVGSYAYNIQFSDGHSTGIYTLEQLWRLGQGT